MNSCNKSLCHGTSAEIVSPFCQMFSTYIKDRSVSEHKLVCVDWCLQKINQKKTNPHKSSGISSFILSILFLLEQSDLKLRKSHRPSYGISSLSACWKISINIHWSIFQAQLGLALKLYHVLVNPLWASVQPQIFNTGDDWLLAWDYMPEDCIVSFYCPCVSLCF